MVLLSEEDRKSIAEAIGEAESRTSGEIVFALTEASGLYRSAILRGAILGLVLASFLYLAIPVPHTIGILLWVQFVSFAAFYAVLSRIPWRRWFIAQSEMDIRVREGALVEFYARGLYRTRESNGVLIYLSLLERRVVVLGDRAIHEKMGERYWGEVRDAIIRGILAGKAGAGIRAAVGLCGESLARHFPPRADDINELPDQVVDAGRKSAPGGQPSPAG